MGRRTHPEGIAHGEVRVAARRLCLLGLSAQLCHGVHEPGALLVLELLGNLHKVGHVVAKVANLRERVDGPSGGLLAPALNLGEGHAREQVLLDLGAGFHAGEFALGEGALHVALVAAELLGSLPELLREFLRRCEKNQFSVSVGGGLGGGKYGRVSARSQCRVVDECPSLDWENSTHGI